MLNTFLVTIGLLFSLVSFANETGNSFSLSTGIGTIGTELAYGVFLGSPFWNEGRTSFQFGFRGNQLRGIPTGGSSQKTYEYSLLDLSVINRFYTTDSVKTYFETSALIGLPSDISTSTPYALKFSVGIEYLPKDWVLGLFSELGASWGLGASANKLQSSPTYLTGLAFLLGLKKYLF